MALVGGEFLNFPLFVEIQVMSNYGYSIEQTLIVDIEPDATVRRAMNEINAGLNFLSFSSEKLS